MYATHRRYEGIDQARIEGMLPRPSADQATCSVSRAQLEQ